MICLIIAILIALPMAAGTITTSTCTTFGGTQTQTDPSSASVQCSDWPRQDIAAANGTVSIGLLSGLVSVWSNDDASATVTESFTESFTELTTLTWNISVSLDGPWAYVLLDLGPLQESYEEYTTQGSGEWAFDQVLPAGDYTFSAVASVSDEGSAVFSADPPPVPEPSTFLLILTGLALIVIAIRRKGDSL